MGLININCCQGGKIDIHKMLCACFSPPERKEEVLYSKPADSIILLSTPKTVFSHFVDADMLARTEMVTIYTDEHDAMRVATASNLSWFHPPAAVPTPLSGHRELAGRSRTEDGFGPASAATTSSGAPGREEMLERKEPPAARLAGARVQDCLPPVLWKFMKSICIRSLCGAAMQITAMRNHTTYIIRTFPILEPGNTKKIIAALIMVAPFVSTISNSDINQFVMSDTRKKSGQKRASLLTGAIGHVKGKPSFSRMNTIMRQLEAEASHFEIERIPETSNTSAASS